MIEMVVFDMAGTTVDEQNVVYKTLHKAIEKEGYELSLDTVLKHGAGKEKRQAIIDILEHLEGGTVHRMTIDLIFQNFEKMLDEAYAKLTPLAMAGAEKAFSKLRGEGIKVVLNTGYKRSVAEYLLGQLDWEEGQHFDLLVTASEVTRSRPEPDMIYVAMDHFGIKNALNIAKVGDSTVDIEEGRNAGCGMFVGITTGAQDAVTLQTAHPTDIVTSLEEFVRLLKIP
jgi:phosphonatase-like hydrolase